MWHTPGLLSFVGILALFFGLRSGACGFLLMFLAFLFVLSMIRRASYGPPHGGYRGYRGYRGYKGYRNYNNYPNNYPPSSSTPAYPNPPQNNPPTEGASQGNQANPYYANPED